MANRTITFAINTQIAGEATSLGYGIYAQDGTVLISHVAPGSGSGVSQVGSTSIYTVTRADIDRSWEFYIAWDRSGTSLGRESFEATTILGTPAGASLAADIASIKTDSSSTSSTVAANLDAQVSTRSTSTNLATLQTTANTINTTVTTNLDAQISTRASAANLTTAQTTLTAINSVVTTNLDAQVSTRATSTNLATLQTTANTINTTVTTNLDAQVSTRATSTNLATLQTTANTINTTVTTNLDAQVSTRASATNLATAQTTLTTINTAIATNLDAKVSTRSTYAGGAVTSVTNPVTVDLSQAITDVQSGTVGGALNGAWAVAWGKTVIDRVARRLNIWGAGNATLTQSYAFTLDDATRPSVRTPSS